MKLDIGKLLSAAVQYAKKNPGKVAAAAIVVVPGGPAAVAKIVSKVAPKIAPIIAAAKASE